MDKNISFYYGYESDYVSRVNLIKEVGFDGVMALFERAPYFYDAVDYALASGLKVESVHLPFRDMVNDLWLDTKLGEHYFSLMIKGGDYAKQIGVDKLTMHISSKINPPPMCDVGFNRLLKIAEHYEKNGLTLCIENLRRLDYFRKVMEVLPPSVKVCYDVGHHNLYYRDEFDVAECLDRVELLHLHDNFGKKDDHFLPFEGECDWNKICSRIANMPRVKGLTLEVHDSQRGLDAWREEEYLRSAMERALEIEKMVENSRNG